MCAWRCRRREIDRKAETLEPALEVLKGSTVFYLRTLQPRDKTVQANSAILTGRRQAKKPVMKNHTRVQTAIFWGLAAALLLAAPAAARSRRNTQFLYVGGTALLPEGCQGKLELLKTAMVFECKQGQITVPYKSIMLMRYSSKVERRIRKMKLHWAVRPTTEGSKHNLFFTVVFSGNDGTQAMVLRVMPDIMRPYLAEIELQTGHRVDVEHLY